MSENKKRVLIGSPIHQKPAILHEFLSSLLRLKKEHLELSYLFIDDNEHVHSTELLRHFVKTMNHVFVKYSGKRDAYIRNETTHFWNDSLIWKVADFKNSILKHALELNYDYVFLVDSDLVLHPDTIEHLIAAQKDIISEIFWTQWQPHALIQPQVWLRDEYKQWEQQPGEDLSNEEITIRTAEFIAKLRTRGIYEVGGLGACTLISRHAMTLGVNFNPIKNLSFWGEDRHFCIRAAALGIPLFVDTHYPALHVYRDSDLERVDAFKKEIGVDVSLPSAFPGFVRTGLKRSHKLTLTMVVKNEANRFLREILEEHKLYIDEAVIIDDGSTDDTAAICQEVLQGIPLKLITNTASKFSNEIELRKQQWEETLKMKPDWILNVDADERFERQFAQTIHHLMEESDVDLFCFRLYDFWNDTHYREDHLWRAHFLYRPFLLRYRSDFDYKWKEAKQHCGRFPENIFELPHRLSPLRLKHLGWSKDEYRLEKYHRYLQLDPEARFGWKEQYSSILDEHPNLIPWVE